MQVTEIKAQAKDPNRVSIFVDQKYSFSLTIDQLIREKIKKHDQIDVDELKRLKKLSDDEKFRLKCVEWVMMRPRSVLELRQYIRRKKSLEATHFEWIIDQCLERSYVDDEQFARWWVTRSSRAKKSTRELIRELSMKGISRDIIGMVTNRGDDERKLIELIERLKAKPKYQDKQKLTQYLIGKGYHYSLVRETLGSIDN